MKGVSGETGEEGDTLGDGLSTNMETLRKSLNMEKYFKNLWKFSSSKKVEKSTDRTKDDEMLLSTTSKVEKDIFFEPMKF